MKKLFFLITILFSTILFSQEINSYAEGLGIKGSHVSLSDERNHLIAFAVLEV